MGKKSPCLFISEPGGSNCYKLYFTVKLVKRSHPIYTFQIDYAEFMHTKFKSNRYP